MDLFILTILTTHSFTKNNSEITKPQNFLILVANHFTLS